MINHVRVHRSEIQLLLSQCVFDSLLQRTLVLYLLLASLVASYYVHFSPDSNRTVSPPFPGSTEEPERLSQLV
jgi:hypothetical protein